MLKGYWRPKVPELSKSTKSKVTVNVHPGTMSPAQKQAWRKFWQKLITEVKAGER